MQGAVHVDAIDEDRVAFTPTLIDGRLSPPIHGIGGLRRYRLPWWWRLRRIVFGA
ncbi:MAG: hypothetical protein OXG82_02035 [Gammaproteobacteria bacterium]|nr:hypothetical protein [Gammaproteobacteria bacterium]